MAEFTASYSAQFDSEVSFARQPSTNLNGTDVDIPDYAIIRSLYFSIYCGVSDFNSDLSVGFTIADANGNTVSISDEVSTGSNNRIWAEWGGEPKTDLDWNRLQTISLFGTNKLTIRPGYEATLFIGYDNPSAPTPPTSVKVTPSSLASGKATLSWSGALNGNANAIARYEVYRATEVNGKYTYLTDTTATSISVDSAYGNGSRYFYKVRSIGVIDGIDSVLSSAYATLTTEWSAPSAPSGLSVSSTNVGPDTSVTLRWNASSKGVNNPVKQYEIYRSDSADGYYSQIATATETNVQVTSPKYNGESYFYKVRAIGSISGSDSDLSAYAVLTTVWTAPNQPSSVSVSATNVRPKSSVTLSWMGDSAGTNNPIVKYEVRRAEKADGSYSKIGETTIPRLEVVSPEENNTSFFYKVLVIGKLSSANLSTAYAELRTVYTALGTPGTPSVAENYVAPGNFVRLNWSSAAAGTNNNVKSYEVYRSVDGGLFELITTSPTNSASVSAPTVNGMAYTFAVRALGEYGEAYHSQMSEASGALYCDFSAPSIPQNLRINGTSEVFLDAGAAAVLTWEAATGGKNNPLVSYQIICDGDQVGETTDLFYNVSASFRYGDVQRYTVKARAAYSSSQESNAVTITTNIPPSPPKSTESVSDFMFFDKDDALLFLRGDAVELTIVEEEFKINGTFPFDPEHQIKNSMRIGWMEEDQFQMFELRQVTTDAVSMVQTFEGEHICISELQDFAIEDKRPYDTTAEDAASRALEGSDWRVGIVTADNKISSTNYYYESAWSALLKVRDAWGVAIVPRLMYTYEGFERFIDVLDRRGQNRGVRLTLDINAQQAGVTYDDRELYTSLYGRGSSTGDGERLLTMENAYWSIDNGDPANKPVGQQWVEDVNATALWGRKGRKREGFIKFETLDPFELLRLTWDALQACKTPKITIDMTAFDLSALGYSFQGIGLGDDVIAILDPIGLEVQTRVMQNTRDVLRAENSKPVIGSYRPDLIFKIKEEMP